MTAATNTRNVRTFSSGDYISGLMADLTRRALELLDAQHSIVGRLEHDRGYVFCGASCGDEPAEFAHVGVRVGELHCVVG